MRELTLHHNGVPRRVLLAAPTSAASAEGRPSLPRRTVLFLPGTGATAAWAASETGWPARCRLLGWTLAVAEGLPPDPARPAKFLTNPPRWNDGGPGDAPPSTADDAGFLAALIELIRAEDPAPVCVSGFSNGAGMAFRLAAEHPQLVAALAPVAGYCWPTPLTLNPPVPTLYAVGAADPLVPLAGGFARLPWGGTAPRPAVADTLDRWRVALGCDPVPMRSEAGGVETLRFAGPVPFEAVIVEGLGHHWPGVAAGLNPRVAGEPSAKWDATAGIADFFGHCGSASPLAPPLRFGEGVGG